MAARVVLMIICLLSVLSGFSHRTVAAPICLVLAVCPWLLLDAIDHAINHLNVLLALTKQASDATAEALRPAATNQGSE
jgi:hypothetical protein